MTELMTRLFKSIVPQYKHMVVLLLFDADAS